MSGTQRMIVISSAGLVKLPDGYYAYGPYVRELRLWARHCGEIGFVCPVSDGGTGLLEKLDFEIHKIFPVDGFDIKSGRGIMTALSSAPATMGALYRGMKWSSHIHLRCPGNISLLGCLVATLFRQKKKTAKYAGNWDPESHQPLSYRIQKFILNSPALLTHIKVLVYGKWPGSSRNIKPFFTATYFEADKAETPPRPLTGKITMVFAGTLSANKRPLYALELLMKLRGEKIDARLELFGDGAQRSQLESYIENHGLEDFAIVHGNRPEESVRQAYKRAHFTILPSQSEGWPKALAEGMFWGCVALATPVSCVPFMVDHGNRGLLLKLDPQTDAKAVADIIKNHDRFNVTAALGMAWSRQFTVDLFEREIMQLAAE